MKIQYPEGGRYTPGPREQAFIQSRVAKMSPKEILLMNAAQQLTESETAADFINLTFDLNGFILHYPAANEKELGEFVAKWEEHSQEGALAYLDSEKIGQIYNEENRGVFCGGGYVVPPNYQLPPTYYGDTSVLQDDGYSVRLRLISPCNQEGVWLRLPDFSLANCGRPDELQIALDALGVSTLSVCKAVEADCILPQITDLLSQYSNLDALFYDGCNLGYALDEQGQGKRDFMEHFQAALEYEGCTRLDFALDISQNLNCYDFLGGAISLEEYGRKMAAEDEIVRPGTVSANNFNYSAYGEHKLEQTGMKKTQYGYIARNDQKFFYDASQPPAPQTQTMQ